MYNFRVPKERWWEVAASVRRYYMQNHPIAQALTKMVGDKVENPKFFEAVDKLTPEWLVDLQLFDEGDTWLIRPLERSYFFMNNADRWGVERVTYDDRTDVPPEEEKTKAVAVWVDEQIDAHRYFVFSVLTREDFLDLWFDRVVVNR